MAFKKKKKPMDMTTLKGLSKKASMQPEDESKENPKEEATESPAMEASEDAGEPYPDHEVASAADTVMRAHEHMADPKMMKQMAPHLAKKKKGAAMLPPVKSIADLKSVAKSKGAY